MNEPIAHIGLKLGRKILRYGKKNNHKMMKIVQFRERYPQG